jgi:LCP family protein required for cell wall assembly
MADSPSGTPPEYKVYRTRRGPLAGLRTGGLDGLRRGGRSRGPREPGDRRPLTPGQLLRWIALAAVAWLLVALVLFMISAQLSGGLSPRSERALSGGGSLLTGANVLVIGTDTRTGESIDKSQTGPARADTIMVLHASLGGMRRLSIPRDAFAEIPGHNAQKINAAYALGGRSLMTETVERYLGNGLKINHLMEIDFKGFPQFVDSIGGVTVTAKRRICSPPFDNFYKGLRFRRGENHLSGRRALGWARVRKNRCAPGEDDTDRAERQQQLLAGVRSQFLSPAIFFRAPWAAWNAPRAFKTDLHGPGLLALTADAVVGGTGESAVLRPSCLGCGPGGSLLVSEGERSDQVERLERGD